MNENTVLILENCHNLTTTNSGEWKETGKIVPMRWILPYAMVELNEEKHDNCIHYVVTIEFASEKFNWLAQRLKFGPEKEIAIKEAQKIVNKLVHWGK